MRNPTFTRTAMPETTEILGRLLDTGDYATYVRPHACSRRLVLTA